MRRRHRGPPPLPPPLGGIVLDGSNVIASSRAKALQRLALAEQWCAAWRPDLPVMVFLDSSTARRCRPEEQEVLRARCADVTPERPRYAICPRDESADSYLLQYARQHHALVLSNDRYFDHEELRANAITLQFSIRAGSFAVYPEATWFRSPGSAERIELAVLQRLGRPDADGEPLAD